MGEGRVDSSTRQHLKEGGVEASRGECRLFGLRVVRQNERRPHWLRLLATENSKTKTRLWAAKDVEKFVQKAVLRIRIRDPVPFWPLDPGSGLGFFRIPDPKTIFLRAYWQFLGKKFCNSLKIDPNYFLQHFKNKIIFNIVKFVATKKGMTTIFFTPLFCWGFWIRIRDSGSRMGKKSGSEIRDSIPDPQHLWVPQCSIDRWPWWFITM